MAAEHTDERVTPDQIRAKLREIEGTVETSAKAAAPVGLAAGAVAVIAVLVLAYALGRRRGRKRQTFVEIRRI